jgi:lipopolysaccharide biosynthesis glycosyltransferase
LDSDTVIFEDLRGLMNVFKTDPLKAAYYALEENSTNSVYYKRQFSKGGKLFDHKKHFYQPYGLNTGVAVLNLTMMRNENMTYERFMEVNDEDYEYEDQDILNSFAYYYPDKFGVLDCKWNKRRYSPCGSDDNREFYQFNSGIMHDLGAYDGFVSKDYQHHIIFEAFDVKFNTELCNG